MNCGSSTHCIGPPIRGRASTSVSSIRDSSSALCRILWTNPAKYSSVLGLIPTSVSRNDDQLLEFRPGTCRTCELCTSSPTQVLSISLEVRTQSRFSDLALARRSASTRSMPSSWSGSIDLGARDVITR